MKLWNGIARAVARLRNRAARKPAEAPVAPKAEEEVQGPSLSQWVTYGAHKYRTAGEVLRVDFTNAERGVRRTIVDDQGRILDFPGIDESARASLEDARVDAQIRFRTDFVRQPDGGILMRWEVQPDGRYWEDEDGFGGTSDPEIRLYALIDEDGRFTGPFRLYSVGPRQYYEPPAAKPREEEREVAILRGNAVLEEQADPSRQWMGAPDEDPLTFRHAYRIEKRDFEEGIHNCTYRVLDRAFTDLSYLEGDTLRRFEGAEHCELRKRADGTRFLYFFHDIPTFDSSDRDWDSCCQTAVYRRGEEICMIDCRHGYQIPRILVYIGLTESTPAFDEWLKRLDEAT